MEEAKEGAISLQYAPASAALNSLLSGLEMCELHAEYMELLGQLEHAARGNVEIARAHSYLLSKYPNLPNVEPKTIAKLLREYWETKVSAASQRLTLDADSAQNLKKELRKTYHDNNIEFLANSTPLLKVESDIGLDDSLYSAPDIKPDSSSDPSGPPHIFALPETQVAFQLTLENRHRY